MPLSNEEIRRLFSQRLSQLMQKHNINQVELSKILNVTESTVGKWLLMKSIPRMGIIQKLADYFEVGKSYFLEKDISTDGYYSDPEAAEFAEQARTNPEIKVLFSASKDLKKEDMQDVIKYVEFLKSKYQ